MAKQAANIVHRHAEKAVLGVAVGALLVSMGVFLQADMVTVNFDKEDLGPHEIDLRVKEKAEALAHRHKTAVWPVPPPPDHLPTIKALQEGEQPPGEEAWLPFPGELRRVVQFQPPVPTPSLRATGGTDPESPEEIQKRQGYELPEVVTPRKLRVRVGVSRVLKPVKATDEEKEQYLKKDRRPEDATALKKKTRRYRARGRFAPRRRRGRGAGRLRAGFRGRGGRAGAFGPARAGIGGRRGALGGLGRGRYTRGRGGGADRLIPGAAGMPPDAMRLEELERGPGMRGPGLMPGPAGRERGGRGGTVDIQRLLRGEEEEKEEEVELYFLREMDVHWASVGATINLAQQRRNIREKKLPQTRSQILITRVELQRQEVRADGTYGPAETVPPIQNWYGDQTKVWPGDPIPKLDRALDNWPEVGEPSRSDSYYSQLKESQPNVIQPLFYDVIGGELWYPPEMKDVLEPLLEKEQEKLDRGIDFFPEEDIEDATWYQDTRVARTIAAEMRKREAIAALLQEIKKRRDVDKQVRLFDPAARFDVQAIRSTQEDIYKILRAAVEIRPEREEEGLEKKKEERKKRLLVEDRGRRRGMGIAPGRLERGLDRGAGALGRGPEPGFAGRLPGREFDRGAGRPGEFGGMRPGGTPLGGRDQWRAAKVDPLLAGDYAVIWAHDDSVDPGKTYVWRMRLWMYNRLLGATTIVRNDSDAYQVEVHSDWSAWTRAHSIPEDTLFYLRDGGASPRVVIYHRHEGTWFKENFPLEIGAPIGAVKSKSVGRREDRKTIKVDFSTGYIALDLQRVDGYVQIKARGQKGIDLAEVPTYRLVYMDVLGEVFSQVLAENPNDIKRKVVDQRMAADRRKSRQTSGLRRAPGQARGLGRGGRPPIGRRGAERRPGY